MTTSGREDVAIEASGDRTAERSDIEWRRRLIIFGDSIRSDFDNPLATSWRAIMRALTRGGHEAVFIEPRRGESLTRLLRHRGSAPLRQFAEQYPDLQYRTLDLPRGRELSIWLARELALVDAVVVLDNAAEAIRTQIAAYDEPRLLRIMQSADGYVASGRSDPVDLGPAIDTSAVPARQRNAGNPIWLAVLAWDAEQSSLATQVWHAAMTIDPNASRLSLGSIELDGWTPITEMDLASTLRDIDLALVIATQHPAGLASTARSLLPWSLGVPALTIASHPVEVAGQLPRPVIVVGDLSQAIERSGSLPWPNLSRWSADRQAAGLIAMIDRGRAALRTQRS